jgi:hypothetical protein
MLQCARWVSLCGCLSDIRVVAAVRDEIVPREVQMTEARSTITRVSLAGCKVLWHCGIVHVVDGYMCTGDV